MARTEDRAFVRNGADRKQVKGAESKIKLRQMREDADWAYVLGSPEGRRVLWRLLEHCNVFGSVFDPHGSRQSYNIGMQDVGHKIMADITTRDGKAWLLMQREAAQMTAEIEEPSPTPTDG